MPALNNFKSALAAKKPQVGLWLSMADPYLAEVSATYTRRGFKSFNDQPANGPTRQRFRGLAGRRRTASITRNAVGQI